MTFLLGLLLALIIPLGQADTIAIQVDPHEGRPENYLVGCGGRNVV